MFSLVVMEGMTLLGHLSNINEICSYVVTAEAVIILDFLREL